MRRSNNIDVWHQRLADQKNSGLKVDDWCRENHVTRHAYYYWSSKIRKAEVAGENPVETFVEISYKKTEPELSKKDDGIMIRWNGFSFCIQDSKEIPLAAELMQELAKKC